MKTVIIAAAALALALPVSAQQAATATVTAPKTEAAVPAKKCNCGNKNCMGNCKNCPNANKTEETKPAAATKAKGKSCPRKSDSGTYMKGKACPRRAAMAETPVKTSTAVPAAAAPEAKSASGK